MCTIAMSRLKKILLALFIIWLATFMYLWLPGIVPDFLHIREKLFPQKLQKDLADANPVDKVHVVISSESSRLGGMIALINSIIVSKSKSSSDVFFHLITDAASASYLKFWLMNTKLKSINYEIIEFPEEWVANKIKFRGTRTELANPINYARFYLPRLLPHEIDRIVYLDDDCIVQDDVAYLYHTKLKPGTLAAFAEECQGPNKRVSFMKNMYADYFDLKNKHFQELKIKPTTCSFNAGVFVANLTEWRQHNITEQLEHWLELNSKEELYGNEKAGGGAQPPMMLVFYNNYTPLDPMWNLHSLGWSPRSSYRRQYLRQAKLLHWSGPFKPWGQAFSFQDVWDAYYVPDPTMHFQPMRRGKSGPLTV